MKAFDRIIFIIVGLFFIALAAGIALVAIDYVTVDTIIDFIKNVDIKSTVALIVMIAEIVVFFIIGIKILFVRPKRQKISACSIMKTEEGEALVSVTAVENTVRLAMATFDDVKESKIAIRANQTGVNVNAKIAVPTGIFIPELITNIRNYIKSFTEERTGVQVNNIKIVATEYKQIDSATEKKRIATEKKNEEKRAIDEQKAEEKRVAAEQKAEEKKAEAEQKAEEKKFFKKNQAQQEPAQTHARLFVVATPEEAPVEETPAEEAPAEEAPAEEKTEE